LSPSSSLHSDSNSHFDQLYSFLEENYDDVWALNRSVMDQKALWCFVDALWDPYTRYLDSQTSSFFLEWLEWESEIAGIGAMVMKRDDGLIVERVLKWSPAALAWLRAFDIIVDIDEDAVSDESLIDLVMKIRWPIGSIVSLWVVREDKKSDTLSLLDFEIERAEVSVESVLLRSFDDDWLRYLLVEIMEVWEETDRLLREKLSQENISDYDGVIVDVRWNSWGFLVEWVDISSHFIKKWEEVVRARYRSFKDDVFYAKWYETLVWLPLVVLIDGQTASAGEIIALALREQAHAVLVWEDSFGKWTIQSLQDYSSGTLKFTVGKRLSPAWIALTSGGVVPDVYVDFDDKRYKEDLIDLPLEKAKDVLSDLLLWS